jgi:hypothetical protein
MQGFVRAMVITLVVAPWILVAPYMLWLALLIVFPDHHDPLDPHEVLSAQEVWEQGLRPILLPIGIGAYVYILFLAYLFVGSRKAA